MADKKVSFIAAQRVESVNSIIDGYIQAKYNKEKTKQSRYKIIATLFVRGFRAGFAGTPQSVSDAGVSDKDWPFVQQAAKMGQKVAKDLKEVPPITLQVKTGYGSNTKKKNNIEFDKFIQPYLQKSLKSKTVINMIQKQVEY